MMRGQERRPRSAALLSTEIYQSCPRGRDQELRLHPPTSFPLVRGDSSNGIRYLYAGRNLSKIETRPGCLQSFAELRTRSDSPPALEALTEQQMRADERGWKTSQSDAVHRAKSPGKRGKQDKARSQKLQRNLRVSEPDRHVEPAMTILDLEEKREVVAEEADRARRNPPEERIAVEWLEMLRNLTSAVRSTSDGNEKSSCQEALLCRFATVFSSRLCVDGFIFCRADRSSEAEDVGNRARLVSHVSTSHS
eukprot:768152-Hanusia_phi.AAC.1